MRFPLKQAGTFTLGRGAKKPPLFFHSAHPVKGETMTIYVLALLIGVVCGLRAMTGPAIVSGAAWLGMLPLENTWLAFLAHPVTSYILSALAIGELFLDQLPDTPSRKIPMQFITRVVTGAFCGVALGVVHQAAIGGLIAGAVGAVIGTLGGYEFRSRLVKATGGKDLPVALAEDVIAIGGALWIVHLAL